MSNPATAQIPLHVLHQLAGAAAQLNIDLPGIAKFAPTVDVTMPIRAVALELGRIVAQHDIFLKGKSIVTVDSATGEIEPMSATRFVGWVEEFVAFTSSGRSQRMRDSLAREDATIILDADIFRGCLRPLAAVHTMRLPVRRPGELFQTEFLAPGYDAQSQIYTVEALKYDMTWTIDQATEFLNAHGKDYPWAWGDDVTQRDCAHNRSFAVHVAAMLGVYCRAMFPPGVRRPMISYVANQAGTGKSTLVSQALMPTFGHSVNTKIPKDDDKMEEELNTVAINRRPYLFFDDIGGGIFSHPLNAFITATGRQGRILGGNTEFHEKLATQVFCTGNDIKISADLMRRGLIAELFLAGDQAGREFEFSITAEYLAKEETRAKFLSAFCAIVRTASEELPKRKEQGTFVPVKGLATFEDWTSTISLMVQNAGYPDPLAPPDLSSAGDEDNDEMRELLVKVATSAEGDAEYDRKELVEFARANGLLEPLVGVAGDKDLDQSAMKRWGRQLQKWRGRELVDLKARRFRFSHKRQKRGAKYPLTFIKPKPAIPAAE